MEHNRLPGPAEWCQFFCSVDNRPRPKTSMLKSVNCFCYWEGACQCVHTPPWLINDQPLEKYSPILAGGYISSNLSWSKHVSNICSSKWACCIAASIMTVSLTHWKLSSYTSSVRPLLEFAVFVIHILWRTLQPWNLFKDLLLKCVQCPGPWEDVDYDERLCMFNLPTLKAIGGTPWNLLLIQTPE